MRLATVHLGGEVKLLARGWRYLKVSSLDKTGGIISNCVSHATGIRGMV